MLTPPAATRVHLHRAPVDMRLSFDRLAGLARDVCRADPLSGHFFVFGSRRRDRVKILYWDRDGLALWYKRLERGTFPWPAGDDASVTLTPLELSLLLDGVDLARANLRRRRPRFVRDA